MKDLILISAEEFIDKWNKQFNTALPYIESKFNLTGKCAGQFCWNKDKVYFRWNLSLAKENSDDYLINTIGHEVAHYIVYCNYPKAKAHGIEWQTTMKKLGLIPKRCHNYNAKPARIIKRPFKYICPCGKIHLITATKFKNFVLNRISSNGLTTYSCNTCHTPINIKDVKPQENL